MLNHRFFQRTFQAALLCLFILPSLSQAQQRDKVSTLEDDLRSLQKDFFSLQKEVIDLEKTVARSGISEGTGAELKKLNEVDVLKANIEKLSAQIETLNGKSGQAAPAVAPSADDSAAVAALKTEVGSLSGKIDGLQAQLKKVSEAKGGAPAPAAVAPPPPAPAANADLTAITTTNDNQTTSIAIVWTLICGFLVMFMQAGFALVETGFTRAKNAAHTMSMNFMVYSLAMLGYWVCGFAIQMGGTADPNSAGAITTLGPDIALLNHEVGFFIGDKFIGLFGNKGYMLSPEYLKGGIFALFLFQMVFMDTTATVPTGAMAERWKFLAFVIFGFLVGGIIYPIYANWVWGGGWLAKMGTNFGLGHGHVDFAGSSVVHLCGGTLAFVGVKILGPRYGKFNKDGSSNPISGHDIPMGVLGTFILAFGWFGFNAGSTLNGNDAQIGIIATNTMLASAAGALAGMTTTWFRFGRPDPSFMCNGLLAGAVAITAPCAFVESWAAVFIGLIAGVLVVFAAYFVEDKLKIDDPVGAIAVHGVNGAWGVLALGLFANGRYGGGWNSVGVTDYMGKPVVSGVSGGVTGLFYGDASQFMAQLVGTGTCIVAVGAMGYAMFMAIEKMVGNRVAVADEIAGLDIPEMGSLAYPADNNPTPK